MTSDRADRPIPIARLDPEEISPQDQFEAWHQSTAPLFDTAMVSPRASFGAEATCYLCDSLLFTRVRFDRMHFIRGSRNLAHGESDSITLHYYRSGSLRGQLADGTPLFMAPDRISIHDFAHPYIGIGETSEQYGVVIPRHQIALHERIYRQRPVISWAVDSPQGRLLTSALAAVWRELPTATQAQAGALASGFVGLINGLLAAEPDPADGAQVQLARLGSMKDFLRANLHRTSLGVEDLCRAFHCSRATVYRLFGNLGGANTYLRDLRLGHCFQELALTIEHPPARVRHAAERWGFQNASHFSRLFGQRFGSSPSELLSASTVTGSMTSNNPEAGYRPEVERLRGWLERY